MKKTLLCGILLAATTAGIRAQSVEGTSYCLPKLSLRFTVKVEKTTYTPGRLAPYARTYMKTDVAQQPSETYRIIGVDADPYATPDTSRQFTLTLNKKTSISNVSLTADGQLLAINADATQPTLAERTFTPARRPAALNPADYMTQDMLRAGSSAKIAELVAQEIYDIRDSRNQLSRGESDALPKDGAQLKLMYDNMDTQEHALLQLFNGTTERDTSWVTLTYTPTKEGTDVLCRFSRHFGLVAADDLSGAPVSITVANQRTALTPAAEPQAIDKNDIGLRVALPGRITVSVAYGQEQLYKAQMQAAQFGEVESLSSELFGKKQSTQIILDPLTGAIRDMKAIAVE